MPNKKTDDMTASSNMPMQPPLMSLTAPVPQEHVDHAAVLYNEMSIRKRGFEAGLAAIEAESAGKKMDYEERLVIMERDHASDMASLDRRRQMMEIGIEMLNAGLAAWPEAQSAPAETPTAPYPTTESSD